MRQRGFLHKTLSNVMHKKRLDTLILAVGAVLTSKKLSLTELGRGVSLKIQQRSGIRKIDRLLGNHLLFNEVPQIDKVLVKKIIGGSSSVDLIVDWTGVPNTTLWILRAAIASKGRAITVYEKVYSEKEQNTHAAHKEFLLNLKKLIPCSCKPIVITDGGFHNAWFQDIEAIGWDYLGRNRVGNGKKYKEIDSKKWEPSVNLSDKATGTPKYFGRVYLCKKGTIETNIFLYKGKKVGRKARTKYGKDRLGTNNKKYRSGWKEAWVLTTSLPGKSYLSAKKVVKKYKGRMQIEEGFRDLKSTKTGFSFRNSQTKKVNRIEILLLIARVASFTAWVVGCISEQRGLHYQFQSNSIKDRRVLSLFYLGCLVIKKKIPIKTADYETALEEGLSHG